MAVCMPAPAVGEKKRLALGIWLFEFDVPCLLPVPNFSMLIVEPIGAGPYGPSADFFRPPLLSPM